LCENLYQRWEVWGWGRDWGRRNEKVN